MSLSLTNLKLTVLDGEGQALEGDLYSKVIKREAAQGCVGLRFTSVPPPVKKLFKIRAAHRKEEQRDRPDHHRAGTMEEVATLSKEEVEKHAAG